MIMDEQARDLLARKPELLELVHQAVEQMRRVFADAELAVEYLVDPEDDEPVEQIYVVAYTSRADRLRRLRAVNRSWWRQHPRYGIAPLTLTAHWIEGEPE